MGGMEGGLLGGGLEVDMVEKRVGRERLRMRMLRWGEGDGGRRIVCCSTIIYYRGLLE